MRRFVLPPLPDGIPSRDGGRVVNLGPKDTKRLTAVLRLGSGDTFPGIDADGILYSCTIGEVGRGICTLLAVREEQPGALVLEDIRGGVKAEPGSPKENNPYEMDRVLPVMPKLVLAVALLKGTKLDDVVRAATEAGVSAIIPLVTRRSLPRGDQGGRMERYRRIAAEAIGQSGSTRATAILPVAELSEFAREYAATAQRGCLVFHETPLAPCSLHRYCTATYEEIVACIGPEGGFSDEEIKVLAQSGFAPAWLGPTVLRAETAAVFALASLRIICLERFSWSTVK